MATAESLKDDHLTCSICYMPFTEPKTLQCLHTFCKECLQHHINHVTSFRGIPCPVCRQMTVVDDAFQPRQRWSQLIKTDFKLAGILEALHKMERDKPSQGDAIVVTSSLTPGNDRKTQLNTMLQLLRPAVSFIQGKVEEEKQHQQVMKNTRVSTEEEIRCFFGQLTDALKVKEMKLLDDLTATHEIGKQESEENVKMYKTLVDDTRDTIGLIDRLLSPGSEYATMECLPRIQKQQDKIMRFISDPPTCSRPIQFSFRANLNKCLSAIRNMDLGSISGTSYTSTREDSEIWKKNLTSLDKTCKESPNTTASSNDLVNSTLNQPVVASPSSTNPVGKSREDLPDGSVSTRSQSRVYALKKTVETKLEEDSYVPNLKNIVVLQGKHSPIIIVLDYDNASLKAISESDGHTQTCSHRFSGYPQSLAKFGDDRVIVSLMNYKFMVFTADLKQVSNIESDKWYSCLTTYVTHEKLFGFVNTSTTTIIGGRLNLLEQLSVRGKSANRWTKLCSNEDLFADISYIYMTVDDHVVVSDMASCAVTCLTLGGDVLWRMSSERTTPAGVAADSNGDVYTVDKERERVLKISGKDGEIIGDILTREHGLKEPLAVALDSESTIYVTQQNGSIRVYSLSPAPLLIS